jgi:hypothetical protein
MQQIKRIKRKYLIVAKIQKNLRASQYLISQKNLLGFVTIFFLNMVPKKFMEIYTCDRAPKYLLESSNVCYKK